MVFNPSFNNISAISLPSVLPVEETGVPVDGVLFTQQNGKEMIDFLN
jgi:hypothetical protein